GGPNKTKIKLAASADYKLAGEFQPQPPPEVRHYDDIWPSLAVEEHEGKVTWSAPLEIAAGVNPAQLEIAGAVNAQVCAKDCLPPTDYKFVAHLASDSQAKAAAAEVSRDVSLPGPTAVQPSANGATTSDSPAATRYLPASSHVTLSGEIQPAPPGGI